MKKGSDERKEVTARRGGALFVAAIYAVLGGAWIVFSDRPLRQVVGTGELFASGQLLKGLFYICGTTLLVYLLVRVAGRRLRASERKYRELFEAASDAIFLHGIQQDGTPGRFLDVNREELLSRTVVDIDDPQSRGNQPKIMKELEEKGQATFLSTHVGRDGTRIPVEIAAHRFERKEGPVVLAVARDISERKRAHAELVKLHTAVEQLPEMVAITGAAGGIEYVNPACQQTTGVSRNEAVGVSLWDLFDDGQEEALSGLHAALARGEPWSGRVMSIKKAGKELVLQVSVAPVHAADGELLGHVVVGRDITEELSREERARQSQKLEAIGTLAGGIAHDFNNILQGIMGYTEFLSSRLDGADKAKDYLDKILAGVRRAAALVEQILTFGRQSEQKRRPLYPHTLIKEALKLMRETLPATIRIEERIDTSCPPVLADPVQIHQVVVNLCTNAWQAMPETGGVLAVGLERVDVDGELGERIGMRAGGAARLTVSDTGRGMDQETLGKIFEPYFTTRGESGGTGLGLAIVHGIVADHEGAVSVTSSPGEGAEFQVFLPLIEKAPDRQGERSRGAQQVRGRGHVLFVDDESAIAEMAEMVLSEYGFEVTVTTRADEALRLIRESPESFDVLVTDMTMPGMLGTHLALRARELRPGLPVLLYTGFSESVSGETLREAGISRLLMKPVAPLDLARAINEVLGER